MGLVSRDTMRAAALQRQALDNDMVPSALLLEVLKAYTDLKDRVDETDERTDALIRASDALQATMPPCVAPYAMPPNARAILAVRDALQTHPRTDVVLNGRRSA